MRFAALVLGPRRACRHEEGNVPPERRSKTRPGSIGSGDWAEEYPKPEKLGAGKLSLLNRSAGYAAAACKASAPHEAFGGFCMPDLYSAGGKAFPGQD